MQLSRASVSVSGRALACGTVTWMGACPGAARAQGRAECFCAPAGGASGRATNDTPGADAARAGRAHAQRLLLLRLCPRPVPGARHQRSRLSLVCACAALVSSGLMHAGIVQVTDYIACERHRAMRPLNEPCAIAPCASLAEKCARLHGRALACLELSCPTMELFCPRCLPQYHGAFQITRAGPALRARRWCQHFVPNARHCLIAHRACAARAGRRRWPPCARAWRGARRRRASRASGAPRSSWPRACMRLRSPLGWPRTRGASCLC